MSKKDWIEAKRLEPIGIAGIERCKEISAGKCDFKAMKINEVFVDAFSASAIAAVHRALNDANKAKLEAMPVAGAADLAFKIIKKVSAGGGVNP